MVRSSDCSTDEKDAMVVSAEPELLDTEQTVDGDESKPSSMSETRVVDASEPATTVTALEKSGMPHKVQDQSIRLPFRKLVVIYLSLGFGLTVMYMDQTSVTTAAPTVGADLNGSDSISWVGTAYLVANCALGLVYGRLSDIFGRKLVLQMAILLLALGNLLAGFAKTPIQLYVFRAIAGSGGGGIHGMAMVVISDIVPLKERGKYQGFITAAISLGNAVGPFIGGGFASSGHWRWAFWLTTMITVPLVVVDQFTLPLKPVTGSIRTKLRQVDYLGVFLSVVAIVLLLVPIAGGGSTLAWNSAAVIVMIIIGALAGVAFVISQWKFATLPIMPLRMFTDRNACFSMASSFLVGIIFYANIFYVPMYFQYVKGYSAVLSGVFVMAFTCPQAIWSICAGYYTSHTGHYRRVLGTSCYTLGMGLQLLWARNTNIGQIIALLQLNAIGIGSTIQTMLVAALTTTPHEDRAVITASRNFFRMLGGAFGLAISSAIYSNVVSSGISDVTGLSPSQRTDMLKASLSSLDTLDGTLRIQVIDVYNKGIKMVFVFCTAAAFVSVLTVIPIKEVPLRRDSAKDKEEKKQSKESEKHVEATANAGSVESTRAP